jgi:Fur family ferric uptake transcriptional regulator
LVRRCLFGDGKVRYEIDHGSHHHHHIICRSCGQVRPLSKCALNALEESARETGYAGISHSLEFFGTCPRCVAR